MASRIIGVLGKKRHGKDTFAARLTEEHGFTRFAFADALREAALKLDPWILPHGVDHGDEDFDPIRLSRLVARFGWEYAKEYGEVRRTLQHMGVGVRDLDEDFWVNAVMRQVDAHTGPVVITDVRFPNEVAAVISRAGRTVRVVNPRVPVPPDQHISETALDLYQPRHVVMNSGTIGDLHAAADRIAYLP